MQAEEQTQTSTEVKPLGELLEYQDSSIVSRVLLKNNGGTVTPLNASCVIPNFTVSYTVASSKVPADSVNFTNLTLTAAPFTMPAGTCTLGGNPAPDAITNGLNNALALPNAGATSTLNFAAGAVPPPPVTTTTTIPPTTTTTAAADVLNCYEGDFDYQDEAQAVLDEDPSDPNDLDGDENGIACEDLPVRVAVVVRANATFTG